MTEKLQNQQAFSLNCQNKRTKNTLDFHGQRAMFTWVFGFNEDTFLWHKKSLPRGEALLCYQ